MRLIDADELNIYDISPVYGFVVMGVTEEDINAAPTVDAVKVVLCCNCKWSKESSGRLFCTNGYNARAVDPYGFCERGKR